MVLRPPLLALCGALLFVASTAGAPSIVTPQRTTPGSRPDPGLDSLVRALRDTTSLTRIQAMHQIEDHPARGEREARAIVRLALEDPDPEVRRSTRWALDRFGRNQPVIVDLLAAATASPDTLLRANGLAALGKMAAHSERVLPIVLGFDDDPHPTVRAGVNTALEDVDTLWTGQLSALVAFFEECDPRVRYHAGTALVLAGVEAVPPMLRSLEGPDANRRANAARVLGRVGETDGRVATALVARLEDEDFRVRQHALQALGQLGTPRGHDAYVAATGVETHGAARTSLVLGDEKVKPDTTLVAVAAIHREERPVLERFRAERLPDVVIAEEHRVYLCDVEKRTVRELARVPVPPTLRSEFTMTIVGWQRDSVVLQLRGQPAYVPNRNRREVRWRTIDPAGNARDLPTKPGFLASGRNYRDTAQGRHFLYVSASRDRIDRRDVIDPSSSGRGSLKPGEGRQETKETVFRVDPERAELLPVGR